MKYVECERTPGIYKSKVSTTPQDRKVSTETSTVYIGNGTGGIRYVDEGYNGIITKSRGEFGYRIMDRWSRSSPRALLWHGSSWLMWAVRRRRFRGITV